MRIIGNIPHPNMKITIFKMNDKVSVKFEDRQLEHIVKFRAHGLVNNADEAQAFFTEEMISDIQQLLINNHGMISERMAKMNDALLEKYPKII